MIWWLETMKSQVSRYWGIGAIGLLFLCTFVYIFVRKKNNADTKVYLWYVFLLLALILNPIFMKVVDISGHMEVYERFFWLLFSPLAICTVLSELAGRKRGLWIGLALLIILCGRTVYTTTEYKPAENVYKIRQEAIEVSEIILRDYEGLPQDAEIVPNRQGFVGPKAIVAEPICEDIRMYNANIKMLFVRRDFGSYRKNEKVASNFLMDHEKVNLKRVIRRMKKSGYTYAVFSDEQILPSNFLEYNIHKIGKTENYTVYKLEEDTKTGYKITSFADVEGYQCMSYIIEDGEGGIIVVDGGRAWQTLSFVEEIRKRGNRVDYWIITHPHDDHCGVLASLLEAEWDKSELYIGEILIGVMDYPAVENQGIRVDTYNYLLNGLNKHENVTWLCAGEERNLLGLRMEVLHTCNDLVIAESDNILNDGSMVFKLSGQEESFLFLADIGELVADEIIEAYGDKLDSDYVQMSHHGNGSLPDYFFELISPNVAVFDAPDWLMENKHKETGKTSDYTTPHYVELMKSMGAKVVSYDTAPNEIVMH